MRIEELHGLIDNGADVVGQDGSKIGKMGQVFLDDQTSEPEWVTVKTGLFGTAESFIPLGSASIADGGLRVAFDKDKVKDAPRVDDADGHLSESEEARLYEYYGLDPAQSNTDAGLYEGSPRWDTAGQAPAIDTTGEPTDLDAGRADLSTAAAQAETSTTTSDDSMTRSEEQVSIGTEQVASGKVRLRKYVVTENVTQTVPVSREEVRIEREPITGAERDEARAAGGELTSDEQEINLSEERVVVTKETVPVERVRVGKETVTDQEQVSTEVRKEQIDTDDVDLGRDLDTADRELR